MENEGEYKKIRIKKLQNLKDAGIDPYPALFEKTHQLKDIFTLSLTDRVICAGRIMTFRDMGKICFAHLQDVTARAQVAWQKDKVATSKELPSLLDLGDFIGI